MSADKRREKKRAKRRVRKNKERVEALTQQARQQRLLRQDEISVQKEAQYIIGRARQGDSRVVTLGELLFFSTATGDAWLLDTEDGLALRLARDGLEQPYRIAETPNQFAIAWEATFTIEDDRFLVREHSGATRVIVGYPLAEIRQAIDQAE